MARESGPGGGSRGIALVGYRATGKSTVGRIVADRLGWPFEDADRALERRAGKPIAAIFAEQGENAFRDLEQRILAELADGRSPMVLATGGGVVLRQENRDALGRFGFVAWLAARPETIADRLRADPDGRPALTSAGLLDEVASVLERREPLYRRVASAVVETDGRSPEQVAEDLLDRLDRAMRGGDRFPAPDSRGRMP
ncbi:shikimate kinase [Tautonia sociabilis]|uniref:Shikimate kinase n=1 Tax=Tautonia sociabilis TaxID=2080755 RepID=A0A432MFP6_9BACT|nr:shikimate kinase [Tautonia sociabilis]RUL85065.1 shikimate kinase [Tautonia sociabilis]